MQNFNYDDGIINLNVNGTGRIFSFNPTDTHIYEGFLKLLSEAPQKLNKLSIEAEKMDKQKLDEKERAEAELKVYSEVDKILREGFDEAFGEGQADVLFGAQCVCAYGKNGDFIFANALLALVPFFEKEMKKRKEKVRETIKQYKE